MEQTRNKSLMEVVRSEVLRSEEENRRAFTIARAALQAGVLSTEISATREQLKQANPDIGSDTLDLAISAILRDQER